MGAASNTSHDDQRERIIEALRTFGEGYDHLARTFAASMGLHSTDATALIEILRAEEQGEPLSPARLGERIGLTSGATSTLLNRLENAEHIVRSRVHTDRRIVTLQAAPQVQAVAEAFFDPLDQRIGEVMAHHSPEALDQFTTILLQLHDALQSHATDHE